MPVARQPARQYSFAPGVHRCNRVARCQLDQLIAAAKQKGIGTNQHSACSHLIDRYKYPLDITFRACMKNMDLSPKRPRRRLHIH